MRFEQLAELLRQRSFVAVQAEAADQTLGRLNVLDFGNSDEENQRFQVEKLLYAEDGTQIVVLILEYHIRAFVLKMVPFNELSGLE